MSSAGALPAGVPPTIEWVGGLPGRVRLVDQTLLPGEVRFLERASVDDLIADIKRLAVRGAPAIGIAGAYAVVLGIQASAVPSGAALRDAVKAVGARVAAARPTAVNLGWAVARMGRRAEAVAGADASAAKAALLDEARAIHAEDRATCAAIGRHGAALVREGMGVLTHCNAGALATGGTGTALAPLFAAAAAGRRFAVFADETRPLMQGARLTAFELSRAGIPVTVLCDGAAAAAMRAGKIQMAIVGADRIAANGDVANKIGTYGVAVAARAHAIPFYVAAPLSTFDLTKASGAEIPIEERDAAEVTRGVGGQPGAPAGVPAWNPAFDVTPAELVTAIITERGILERPDAARVAAHCDPRAGRSAGAGVG